MKNGGSAFPQHACENCQDPMTGNYSGMSLRDYFAGQIVTGAYLSGSDPSNIAIWAYEIADAMIAERSKKNG